MSDLEAKQDEAYFRLLEKLANENDPENIQKYADAIAKLEKGRNDRERNTSDYILSESKQMKENELAERKLQQDRELAEQKMAEEREDRKKSMKSERRKNRFDGVMKLLAFGGGIGLSLLTFVEEDTSFVKRPKTLQNAKETLSKYVK